MLKGRLHFHQTQHYAHQVPRSSGSDPNTKISSMHDFGPTTHNAIFIVLLVQGQETRFRGILEMGKMITLDQVGQRCVLTGRVVHARAWVRQGLLCSSSHIPPPRLPLSLLASPAIPSAMRLQLKHLVLLSAVHSPREWHSKEDHGFRPIMSHD